VRTSESRATGSWQFSAKTLGTRDRRKGNLQRLNIEREGLYKRRRDAQQEAKGRRLDGAELEPGERRKVSWGSRRDRERGGDSRRGCFSDVAGAVEQL
jgi:hypothetical protein